MAGTGPEAHLFLPVFGFLRSAHTGAMRVFDVPLSTGAVAKLVMRLYQGGNPDLASRIWMALNANQPYFPLSRADRDIIRELLFEDTPQRLSELRDALRREQARTGSPRTARPPKTAETRRGRIRR